jgi:CRP/FNR family transcriptional regulator, anaerobic regulatory protein
MTSGTKSSEQAGSLKVSACSSCQALGVPCALEAHATTIRTRRDRSLPLGLDGGETVFIVRSGVLILELALPAGARQIVGLYYPGDLLRASFAPPHAGAAFVAAAPGEVWRLRATAFDALAATDPAVLRYLDQAIGSRIARQALHAVTLGQFDCEQKLAALLLELAIRTGTRSGGSAAFELPFDRKYMAGYLGLNPDTLSRIISRFTATGLIARPGRNRIVVRDLAALAARSPVAGSLMEMGPARSCAAPLGAGL